MVLEISLYRAGMFTALRFGVYEVWAGVMLGYSALGEGVGCCVTGSGGVGSSGCMVSGVGRRTGLGVVAGEVGLFAGGGGAV